jgi:predicted RNA-binding Zn ribbon-like protein
MSRNATPPTAPSLEAAQSAGFVVGGEPLALDLADTVVTVTDPPTDLLSDDDACRRFWELQATRLPEGWTAPSLAATRQLRDAVRRLLDSALAGQTPEASQVQLVNRASAAAPTAVQGKIAGKALESGQMWFPKVGQDLALAAAARSAIDALTDPVRLRNLRRCANPSCSMLFVNGDARRTWCTPNICGNRTRVARHYQRQRATR